MKFAVKCDGFKEVHCVIFMFFLYTNVVNLNSLSSIFFHIYSTMANIFSQFFGWEILLTRLFDIYFSPVTTKALADSSQRRLINARSSNNCSKVKWPFRLYARIFEKAASEICLPYRNGNHAVLSTFPVQCYKEVHI